MNENLDLNAKKVVTEPTKEALRIFLDLVHDVSLKLKAITENQEKAKENKLSTEDSHLFKKYKDVSSLCYDQIVKCTCLMTDVFKNEIIMSNNLEESRQFVMDRICWCIEKVNDVYELTCGKTKSKEKSTNGNISSIQNKLDNMLDFEKLVKESFISWIDDCLKMFDLIEKLFVQDDDCASKCNDDKWRNECTKTMINFHKLIRELVFAAMDIGQNCLESDKKIVDVRCHVVLRESKNLISEILSEPKIYLGEIEELDLKDVKLKNELHFPTISMFNNILRDAVCNLETTMNRAVLSMVLKCLINPSKLLMTFVDCCKKGTQEEKSEDIKQFDTNTEQIIQIGLFSITCSADEQRVLQLKSCLASLEILETYLIPTILSNPDGSHVQFLVNHWIQEVQTLRNAVFLIIDPVAFLDLVIEKCRDIIKSLKKADDLDNQSVQYLIDYGKCVVEYIDTYYDYEPQIFQEYELLPTLLRDLKKVVDECIAVKKIFLEHTKNVTVVEKKYQNERIMKRLKLLYTLLSKIADEFVVDGIESDTFDTNTCDKILENSNSIKAPAKNCTTKNHGLFNVFQLFKSTKIETASEKRVQYRKKISKNSHFVNNNKTLSRTTIIRSRINEKIFPKKNETLQYITKRLDSIETRKNSIYDMISASRVLDSSDDDFLLANVSENDLVQCATPKLNSTKNKSIFYSEKRLKSNNRSLRRQVLLHQAKSVEKKELFKPLPAERTITSLNDSLDLHLTDILEQLSELSDTMTLLKIGHTPVKKPLDKSTLNNTEIPVEQKNVLTLKINESVRMTAKKIWNIKISNDEEHNKENQNDCNQTVKEFTPIDSIDCGIDVSFGNSITTPERLNDIYLLEQKLAKLKEFWQK